MRRELEVALQQAETLAPAELPAFLGELEQIRVTALARLSTPALEARTDELLDIDQASQRLNVSRDYLYRHSQRLPFVRRIGRKLLFSAVGLDMYLRKRDRGPLANAQN